MSAAAVTTTNRTPSPLGLRDPAKAVSAVPSVHPQETKCPLPTGLTYRQKLLLPVAEEYAATLEAYKAIDFRDSKHRYFDLEECRTDAWLAVKKHSRTVLVLSHSCRLRWCPICSRNKASQIADAVTTWLVKYPRPKILTLTLKHSADSLAKQITRLYACFQVMRKQKFFREKMHGGIWFFQVKWIEASQAWHPHLHCLLDSEYMAHGYIKQAWLSITGDSDIVDIRVIRKASVAAEYVARYAARPANLHTMPQEQRVEVIDALHGRRLHGKWGSGSDIVPKDNEPLEPDSYVRIAKFGNMVDYVFRSKFAVVLWRCYKSGTPLPLCWDLDAMDSEYPDVDRDTSLRPEPPPKQNYLFLTNPA